jgi:hypothetical protein
MEVCNKINVLRSLVRKRPEESRFFLLEEEMQVEEGQEEAQPYQDR